MMMPPRTAAGAEHSEVARQTVHMSMGAFALTLRWLAWWQAIALAGAAVAFNLFVLPRVAPRLYRAGDRSRPIHGIVIYPLAVLSLLLLFPRRPDIVAAAWGILAIGDGIATLVGRAVGGTRWPWNPEKTVAGTVAFASAASIAGVFLAWWVRPAVAASPPLLFAVFVPPAAAIAAAFVETIPVRLDDNISVAASAGAVLWIGALVAIQYSATPAASAGAFSLARIAAAVVTNIFVAAAGYAGMTVSVAGAIAGAIIGIAIFVALGWQGWTLLFVTFVAASIATRTGRAHKQLLGIAEERGGRRGAGNAIANTGIAMIASVLAALDVHAHAAALAFVAALVAGGSDTIASEIGKAYGRRTWSVTSFARVPPGTSGAMSLEGTAAGVLGAAALGGLAVALGLLAAAALVAVVMAATIGAFVESWLGATLEEPGILNNDLLNFINTAVGAGTAIVLAGWIR